MTGTSEFFQKAGIVIVFAVLCGLIGFFMPLLFDRDVGGALASMLLGIVGVIVGFVLGAFVIRRNFG